VKFLYDRPPDCSGVLTLDDDRPPRSVDDLLHKHIPPLISRALSLPHVLVAEVPEDVLHQVFEFKP
jgi:hypothetical protein